MPELQILVNLPSGFFQREELRGHWERLTARFHTRLRSHDTAEQIAEDLAWADAVLMWSWPVLDHDLLSSGARLQMAAHLDISGRAARVALERGLPVSLGRAAWSPAVAEMALALVLNLLRRTTEYHLAMRHGQESWVQRFPDDIPSRERELNGLTVGVVGFGKIGRRLAELLAPFQCPLLVYDPYVHPDSLPTGAELVGLDALCERSEVVVVCAASNAGSKALLVAGHLDRLRPGAVFVNVARSAIVDSGALLARLQRGDISAALDVFDLEPLALDDPLRSLPNAYLTPHRAGGLITSVHRILAMLIDDIERHAQGQPLLHPLLDSMLPALDD